MLTAPVFNQSAAENTDTSLSVIDRHLGAQKSREAHGKRRQADQRNSGSIHKSVNLTAPKRRMKTKSQLMSWERLRPILLKKKIKTRVHASCPLHSSQFKYFTGSPFKSPPKVQITKPVFLRPYTQHKSLVNKTIISRCPPAVPIVNTVRNSSTGRSALLHQVKRWVNDLERQEPHCHLECQAKEYIVAKLVQTLAETGVLVDKLAAGCRRCNDDN